VGLSPGKCRDSGKQLDFGWLAVPTASDSLVPARFKMEELIARIVAEAGVEPQIAAKAVALILAFLRKEGPRPEVDALLAAIPGAAEAAAGADTGGAAGGVLGKIGGGLMALAGQLGSLGLGMGEMQAVGRQIFAYAREKAGDEAVGQLVAAIPGLGQFL
jgi:hypothetical protein